MRSLCKLIIKKIDIPGGLTIIYLSFVMQFTTSCQSEAQFNFKHHFINQQLPTGWVNGVQTLADYDNDGDLDMTIGSKHSGLYMFENLNTKWDAMKIGSVPFTSLGAASLDINMDGWLDIISSGVWYRNEKDGRFSRFTYDFSIKEDQHIHDMLLKDINNDGKLDLVAEGDDFGFFWYKIDSIPNKSWVRTVVDSLHTTYIPKIHGGFSPAGAGDLDGDGDNDIFMAVAWFENIKNGSKWIKHSLEFNELFLGKLPYGKSTRSVIIDIDGDTDNDIVFSECDHIDAKIGIIENISGDGKEWKLNLFPQTAPGRRSSLHALQVVDFNMDGQLDIITVDQEDMMEDELHSPRWYIYTFIGDSWVEEVLFDNGLGGHDIISGDVDGDGDIDLVSKVWNPWKGSSNKGHSHADYIENQIIR